MFDESIFVSSRIRIARNFEGKPFPSRLSTEEGLNLVPKIAEIVSLLGRFKIYYMASLGENDSEVMFEKHLVSHELLRNKNSGAAIIREDEKVSIMVNEEDHVRIQSIVSGFNLDEAYHNAADIEEEIAESMDFAFSPQFGYLTSCVTNLGTGIRASVMLFLPALSLSGEIEGVIQAVKSKGLTVRGELGEGSEFRGYLFQVSNAISLGITEKETISAVISAVKRIVELEKDERKRLMSDDNIKDLCLRAYGILSNAHLVSFDEYLNFSGQIKLGIALDFLRLKDVLIFDKLALCLTDAGIMQMTGKTMNIKEINKYRAWFLQKQLKNARLK